MTLSIPQSRSAMQSYIVLAQKNVLFHGIWKAQYKVSESLIKSIGTSLSSKPSRACKILLTSAGLTLIMLSSVDGTRRRTDQISFDSLRDVVANEYHPKCLMIIYVDNSNKFSVMAFSSDDEKDIAVLSKAFRDRRNVLQHHRTKSDPQASHNSASHEKQRFLSDGHHPVAKERNVRIGSSSVVVTGSLKNGAVMSRESYGSSQRSDSSSSSYLETGDQEDVFIDSPIEIVHELEAVTRVLVNRQDRPASFNIGIQTLLSKEDSDTESINSSTSVQATKDDVVVLNEEMKAFNILMEKSAGVSAEEHYKRSDPHGNRHCVELSSLTKSQVEVGNKDGRLPEDDSGYIGLDVLEMKEDDNNEDYDARSIGIQTLPNIKTIRRYAKKQRNATTANAYKEKLATLKKRNAITTSRSSSSSDSGTAGNSPTPSPTSGPIVWSHTPSNNTLSTIRSHNSSTTPGSNARSHNSPTISRSHLRVHTQSTTIGANLRTHTPHTINQQQRMVTGPPLGIPRPAMTNMTSVASTVVKSIEKVYQGKPARKSHGGRGQRVVVLTSAELSRK